MKKPQLSTYVPFSKNRKIGMAAATYASQNSCPSDCPLKGAGCYAEKGLTGFHTRKFNKNSKRKGASGLDVIKDEAIRIMQGAVIPNLPLRLHVVGDCRTTEAARILADAAADYQRRGGGKAWAYTHSWKRIPKSAWGSISVLASVHSEEEAEAATARGYTPAIVVKDFPNGGKAFVGEGVTWIPCPNQNGGQTCTDCKLCLDSSSLHDRGMGIAFKKH